MKQEATGTFVVTAVFVTQRTVKARSMEAALALAEETLIVEGATSANLSNWHAHEVKP